jgi:hypothetical protein
MAPAHIGASFRTFSDGRRRAAAASPGFNRRRLVLLSSAFALLTLVAATPAQARNTHVQTASFGSFEEIASMAVDRVSGDVYVYDARKEYGGTGTIQKFDAAGNSVPFSALGSPAGSSNVIDGSDDGYADPDATPDGKIATNGTTWGAQIAVDNSSGPTQGDIYVTAPYDFRVYAFAPSGAYLGTITGNTAAPYKGGFICGVAVDTTGAVYMSWQSHVDRYVPAGAAAQDSDFTGQIRNPLPPSCRLTAGGPGTSIYLTTAGPYELEPGPLRPYKASQFVGLDNPDTKPLGVLMWDAAVNISTGDIYGLQAEHGGNIDVGWVPADRIAVYDSNGDLKDTFATEGEIDTGLPYGGTYGIAVNPNTDVVYSFGAGQTVRIFTPGTVPDVATKAASGVDRTGAVLNGHVDDVGAGAIADCHFEYGLDTSYGTTIPCSDSVPFSGARDVSASPAGLQMETTYHYRVIAANATGHNIGADERFRTHAAVLDLTTEDADHIAPHSAELEASFTGDNRSTEFFFEWGETKAYGQTTSTSPAGSTSGPTNVSAPLEGLDIFSPYHYRVVATNDQGTTYGADKLFFTGPPALPQIQIGAPSKLGATRATLNAMVNPSEADTTYRFDYGTTAQYGLNTPASDSIGTDTQWHAGSADLTDLAPGTTYHYRVVATNVGGTTLGPDQTFTTPDRPRIGQPGLGRVSLSGATVTALVTPNLSPTTYRFEYGITTSYGTSTPESPVGSDQIPHAVSAEISGLTPGVKYHYRVVATNEVGSSYGPDLTFDTVAASVGQETLPQTAPCRRGLVRKHGKCVKKARRSGRRHHRGGSK